MEKTEVKKKVTRQDQLKLRENFEANYGKLYLVRCIVCEMENCAFNVPNGICTWCGWREE